MTELTEVEKLVGGVFFTGLFLIVFLAVAWYPRFEAKQKAIADDQIERGDYGGCLVTSGKVIAVILMIGALGILFMAAADGTFDALNAARNGF